MQQPIFYKNKIVGRIENDKFVTHREPTKHFFRMYNGYGISKGIIQVLKEYKVKWIEIFTDTDKHSFKLEEYENTSKTWNNNGDIQLFVPITKSFENVTKRNKSLNSFFGGQ